MTDRNDRPAMPDPTAIRWHRRLPDQRRLRLLARLSTMGAAEFSVRLRGLVNRRRDPAEVIAHTQARAQRTASMFLDALGDDIPGALEQHFARRFFFCGAQRGQLTAALDRAPRQRERIVLDAEQLLAGRVVLFAQQMACAPAKIDWQADPISGERHWPSGLLDEASAIDVSGADVKYVWELNRQQFLPTLARAYWLTGDARFSRCAAQLIATWIEQNPPGQGVNWCSHLEVGMRAISWLWAMPMLFTSPEFDPPLLRRWVGSIAAHYQHLADNLSVFTDPTNHLIGETTALWMLSSCFETLPEAAACQARCRSQLLRELDAQVWPDGVNLEQASSYHRFVLDFYQQFFILSRKQNTPLPAVAERRIENMFTFATALAGNGNSAPMIGDCDDARAIPLLETIGWDFVDSVAVGASLFGRDCARFVAQEPPQSLLWLLGVPAFSARSEVAESVEPRRSQFFADGGYAFVRSVNSSGSECELLFDTGPLGLWPNASHGHADALSVQVKIADQWLLCDPGTGTYFSDPALRNALRSTQAHATVCVDGFDQADIFGVFKWVNPPVVKADPAVQWLGGPFEFFSACHSGYRRLRRAVSHKRSVLSLNDGTYWVFDWFTGQGEHLLEWTYPFTPDVAVTATEFGVRVNNGTAQCSFDLLGTGIATLQQRMIDAPYSAFYGDRRAAPALRASVTALLPNSLVTVIDCGNDPNANFRLNPGADGVFSATRTTARTCQSVVFDPELGENAITDKLSARAELTFIETIDDSIHRVLVKDGHLEGFPSALNTTENGRFKYYVRS